MAGLFWCMMKEEWRIHSTMFGSVSFALFPVMIGAIAFMGSFLLPLIRTSLPTGTLALLLHSNYLLLGLMVGGFGLLGNEVMNRRFGQASLLANAARTLPLTDRYIFSVFVLKDTLYYFLLWVLPFGLGFLLACPYTGISPWTAILLILSLTLSFLTGLSLIFFLSSLLGRSRLILAVVLGAGSFGGAVSGILAGEHPIRLFPPIMVMDHFSLGTLGLSIGVIILLCAISLILFVPEFSSRSRKYPDRMRTLTRFFSRSPFPALVAKDMIDFSRSGSAVGQTLFSFLIPLIVIWFFLSLTSGYLPKQNLFFLFSITTGVIASTMYTWLTAFDSFASYACLPVSVSMIIRAKVSSFTLLQIIPVLFLTGIGLSTDLSGIIIPALVLCLATSYFALGVTIWLAGLTPNILVYDVRVMARYFLLIGCATALFSTLSFAHPGLALTSLVLFPLTTVLIRRGAERWELEEQPAY